MEIVIIFIKGLLLGLVLTWLFELVLKTNKKLRKIYYQPHKIFFGYHIHHSTYSFLPLIWSIVLLFQNKTIFALFYFGIAIGIIVMHTISDKRFVFIEKQKL